MKRRKRGTTRDMMVGPVVLNGLPARVVLVDGKPTLDAGETSLVGFPRCTRTPPCNSVSCWYCQRHQS